MPVFSYSAVSGGGDSVSGELAAEHERAALRELKRRGLTPLSLAVAARSKERSFRWSKRANLEDHIRLTNELAILVDAGVNLNEAIEIASRSSVYHVFGDALGNVGRDLRRGVNVSVAIRNNITTFPAYVYQLVEAGDQTGTLSTSLKDASAQMQFDDRVRKDIRTALIYPTFLIIMGIVAVLFIFIFVVPRFAAMLRDRIVLLPVFSRSIFMSGLFIRDNLPLLTGIAIVAAFGIHLLLRRPAVRFWLHEIGARLPVIGQALIEAEAGRWTATLATLLRNRVPLVHSLALARETLRLESFKARLSQVERAVRGGSALAVALEDYGIFDESLVNLIRVGERSGRLPEMLKSGADLAAEKGRDRIKRFIALLEPASILFIGAIIGVIVISMFTAIASINSVPL